MSAKANIAADDSNRVIAFSRVLSAPRELVWEAMTDRKHVVNWWGPRGFTTTVETMDLRVGGVWKYTMHGPDGTDYANKSVFKEITKPERIVFTHGGSKEGGPGASFVATWAFEQLADDQTNLSVRMVFPSAADRDAVIREYGAVEGGKQTLMRLSEHLAGTMSQPFVLSREFNAPRHVVWAAWTEPERFKQWFGPKGVTVSLAVLDLRPGGTLHYSMRMPDGNVIWGKAVYREIVPPEKIVWVNSFSDQDAGITRHPFSKDPWPLQLLTEVTFAERNGRTTVTVRWLPLDSTAVERETFDRGRESMKTGWGGTFDQLEEYLTAQS